MKDAILAIVFVLACGLPLAFLITGRSPLVVLVAPLASGLSAATAAILMLLFDGRLIIWLAALLLLQCLALVVLLPRRRPVPLPQSGWLDTLWAAIPVLPPFLMVLDVPGKWDALAIWWTHAGYYSVDGAFARATMGNPIYQVAHPDYPPLSPASVASAWSMFDNYDSFAAQGVSSLLTFGGIAMLAYAVRRVTSAAPALVSRIAGVLVALAAWSTGGVVVAAGYNDALWSTAFVAGAALLLLDRDPFARPALPILLITASVLSKNEGYAMAVLLAVLVTARERRNLKRAWVIWAPAAVGFAWGRIAGGLGAPNDLASSNRSGELLAGQLDVVGRGQQILTEIWKVCGVVLVVAALVAIIGAVFLRAQRRAAGLGSDLWLWAAIAGYFAMLFLIYLTTQADLTWHLATSVDRVTLTLVLLAVLSMTCWAVVALRGEPEPERSDAAPADGTEESAEDAGLPPAQPLADSPPSTPVGDFAPLTGSTEVLR